MEDFLETNNLGILTDILLYHIISGSFLIDDIWNGERILKFLGDTVVVWKQDGELIVNKSNIIQMDGLTTNGVVHIIDAILTFPSLQFP